MFSNNILSFWVNHDISLPRFFSRNLVDSCGDASLVLQDANLLASDVIPSQSAYQGNFLGPKNPGCRHSNVAPRPSRYPGDMFRNDFFTGHWQTLHEAANIPVYGTTYYQADHLVLTLRKFITPLPCP